MKVLFVLVLGAPLLPAAKQMEKDSILIIRIHVLCLSRKQ